MDFRIGNGVLALLHLLCLVFGIVVAVLPGSLVSEELSEVMFGEKYSLKTEMNFFTFSSDVTFAGETKSKSGDPLDGMCDGVKHIFKSGRAEVIIICIFAGISMIIHAASAAVPTLPKVLRTISSVMLYLTMCLSVVMGVTMILILVVAWGKDCKAEKSMKDNGYDFGAGMYMSFVITVLCFIGCVIDCMVKEPNCNMANNQYQAYQPYEAGNTQQGGEMSGKSTGMM